MSLEDVVIYSRKICCRISVGRALIVVAYMAELVGGCVEIGCSASMIEERYCAIDSAVINRPRTRDWVFPGDGGT